MATIKQKIESGIYPTKDQVYQVFIIENHSQMECVEILNIGSRSAFKNLLNYYNIKKSEDEQLQVYLKANDSRKKTCIEKYGTEFAAQNQSVIDKGKQTCLKKYGAEFYCQSQEFQKRDQNGEIKHNYSFSPETVEKRKQTMLKRYGTKYPSQTRISPSTVDILSTKEKLQIYLQNGPYRSITQICDDLMCSYSTVQSKVLEYELQNYVNFNPSRSSGELEVEQFLNQLGVSVSSQNREILNGLEIDLYCPDYKIGIEFNGTYWHSDLNKDKKYHFNKSKKAEEMGIRLIHIYQYEWEDPNKQEIIKSLLKISFRKIQTKIYARNCTVKKISNLEARPFNDKNHLQGHRNAQVTYGLFYNDRLVQLMSFSPHKKYQWEIIRGCPGSNNIVVGGVSKLFKHFISDYQPKSVFSYCDFNKFNGISYEELGMKFIGLTGPDKKIIIDRKVYNRNPSKYKEYKDKVDANIWGAGSKKYLWSNK